MPTTGLPRPGTWRPARTPRYWTKRAVALATDIESTITSLQLTASSDEAKSHYDAAAAALGDLNSIDQRAQDAIARGDTYVASDLVFTDSVKASQHLEDEIAAAGRAEQASADARFAFLQQARFALNAAAPTLVLIVAVVMFSKRRTVEVPAAEAAPAETPVAVGAADAHGPQAPPLPASSSVSLVDAAEVCVDFGRALEFGDVPPLLERAAKVIGAKGIVLWMAERGGAILRPSLVYGYPENVVQRLGSLQVDGDNVTSLAFRSMSAQVVSSPSLGATGAIAVPIVTSTGCIGVLAAEVNQGRPEDDTLSVTRIFAAQLATLIAPAGEATSHAAQA